jgi:hypothetical protein
LWFLHVVFRKTVAECACGSYLWQDMLALWRLRPVIVNSGEYVRYVAFQAGLRQVVQALQGICRLGASFLSGGGSEGSSLLLQLPLSMCLLPLNFPPPFLSFLPLQLQFTLRFELFDARFAARIFP